MKTRIKRSFFYTFKINAGLTKRNSFSVLPNLILWRCGSGCSDLSICFSKISFSKSTSSTRTYPAESRYLRRRTYFSVTPPVPRILPRTVKRGISLYKAPPRLIKGEGRGIYRFNFLYITLLKSKLKVSGTDYNNRNIRIRCRQDDCKNCSLAR